MGDHKMARIRMVNNQLRTNDVTDNRVLDAMSEVPRERFVPAARVPIAYSDQDILISGDGAERYLMKPHVFAKLAQLAAIRPQDRKSTRLNSSHVKISYAVFCLKKKNKKGARSHL